MNLAVCIFFIAASASPGLTYHAKFDSFDAEVVAADPAALEAVVKCLAGLEPCNEQGAAYKVLTMKFFIMVCVTLGLAMSAELYGSENDNIDIEAILNSPEQFKKFVDCFLDKDACDPVPADFKKDMPEAVQQSCAKCTDAQKHLFNRFLSGLKNKSSQDYEAFKVKYDPENKYFAGLEQAVANA